MANYFLETDEPARRAFNAGCDARLQGIPRSKNPYPESDLLNRYWKKGWNDIEDNWGTRSGFKHWVKPLPKVVS